MYLEVLKIFYKLWMRSRNCIDKVTSHYAERLPTKELYTSETTRLESFKKRAVNNIFSVKNGEFLFF